MKSFASDNTSGVHPEVMDAIVRANVEHAPGYGDDDWTRQADRTIAGIFGEDVQPYYAFNGTGCNVIALQALTLPFHSILCASTGHINVDECGAPTRFTSCILKPIPTSDGKLTPELIETELHGFGDQHHSQPKVVYISQATELGTVYTPEEISAICSYAHYYNMYVHMDGSRLANACAHLGVGMRELTRDCGVDILSLGGTKNGMMMGEAVVAFNPKFIENLMYYRKQSSQLYSKMRYLSAQFIAYFENDLWLRNAAHANRMANLLAEKLQLIPEVKITQPVESNAVFFLMPPEVIAKLRKEYTFYLWDEHRQEARLVCSWDTTEEDINQFIGALKRHLESRWR